MATVEDQSEDQSQPEWLQNLQNTATIEEECAQIDKICQGIALKCMPLWIRSRNFQ